MTYKQHELYKKRKKELKLIALNINELPISDEWIEIFTRLCLYRGWVVLNKTQQLQMINIATINSNAIRYLAQQGKKVGLNILEDLSVKIVDEKTRLKAVQLIMDKGVKPSKNDLDLIISTAKNTKSLFDYVA